MSIVAYTEDGKHAHFNGMAFTRDDETGYYLNSTHRVRLHRAVYEHFNGPIPSGCHVHHVNHDKGNNEPDNLVAMSRKAHLKLHGSELTEEQRTQARKNMEQRVRPAACIWHRSNAGREWHKEHYEKMKGCLHVQISSLCQRCGKEFNAIGNGCNKFCSNACKSAWRRASGVDNETRKCLLCGGNFIVNKYSGAKCCSKRCAAHYRHQSNAHSKAAAGARLQHGG